MMQGISPAKFGRALIMDSATMRTTKYLTDFGLPKEQIESVELDPKVSAIHMTNGVRSFCGTLSDLVKRYTPATPYRLLCLDTCNQLGKVSEDVLQMVNKGYVGPNTILVLTVSQRTTGGIFESISRRFRGCLRRRVSAKGLKIIANQTMSYGGTVDITTGKRQSAMMSYFYCFSMK